MRGIVIACALVTGCIEDAASVQPAPVASPDPHKIVSDMLAAYANAKTYIDHGSVTTQFIRTGHDFTKHLTFKTAFVRGDKFRFSFHSDGPGTHYTDLVIWCDGTHTYTKWSVQPGVVDDGADLHRAVSAMAGVSNLSSMMIPGMLLPEGVRTAFGKYRDLRVLGTDTIEGHLCWHLDAPDPRGERVELWIDQTNHMLRRTFDRHHFGPQARGGEFDALTTMNFDGSLDEQVPATELAPPDLADVAPRAALHTGGLRVGGDTRIPEVVAGSPADRAGIRAGDVFVAMDGTPVVGGADVLQRLQSIAIGTSTTFVLRRGAATFEATMTVEADPASPTPLPTSPLTR